jgi:hypothetical protein
MADYTKANPELWGSVMKLCVEHARLNYHTMIDKYNNELKSTSVSLNKSRYDTIVLYETNFQYNNLENIASEIPHLWYGLYVRFMSKSRMFGSGLPLFSRVASTDFLKFQNEKSTEVFVEFLKNKISEMPKYVLEDILKLFDLDRLDDKYNINARAIVLISYLVQWNMQLVLGLKYKEMLQTGTRFYTSSSRLNSHQQTLMSMLESHLDPGYCKISSTY